MVSSFLSVVVPCFNEEGNVFDCVTQLRDALTTAGIPYEIVLVNDGSTDNTLTAAKSLASSQGTVRVVDLRGNFGKAIALREGVRRAKGDILAFFDADLQYSADDLVNMFARVDKDVDLVNGTRDYNGYGSSRTAFSRLYNRTVRLLFRMELRDSNCGIKLLTRDAADADTIFQYGLPLIVPLLKVRGFRSREVAVALHERKKGESKYFQDGQFLGGKKNLRDIVFHSIMLLNLLAHAPLEHRAEARRASLTSS